MIITFTVRNTGMATTGDPIVITSVQRDNEDTLKDGQSDPRVGCTITGAIGPGASKECKATFPIVQDDVDSAPLVLDATATTTIATTTVSSTPFRIYITIMEGISVGFEEPLRLQITESTTATADLVVIRTGALEEEVRVAYITRPFEGNWDSFTATAGEDYADRANPPGIIEFAADAATTTISFDIIHDEVREQRERFEVVLQPPDGVRLIEGRDTKIVTIQDNRDGVDYRPEATLHLNEDGPIIEDSGSVEFAVRLNYAFQQSLLYHVSLDSGAGDAVPGVDFVDPLTVTVNLAPGQKEKTFTVALIDDDEVEDPEDFSLSMTADAGNHRASRLGTTTRATATIVDDDRVAPSEVRLVLTFMGDAFESVPESAGARDVTVTASFHADTPVGTSRTVDPLEVDVFMNARFQGKPQIWIEDGWCEKFGLSDDPETTGQGWDKARVAAWPLPSKDVLVGYYEAMKSCCRNYMSSVTDDELSATMSLRPGSDPEPKETIMGVLVFDNIVHGGQIAFLRGHLEGMGWFV